MTTKTIPLTAVSVQSAKPSTKFGQLSILPISSVNHALLRGTFTGIPATATVQSAILRVRSRSNPWSGTRTLRARYLTGTFSTNSTWNTRPASSTTGEVALTKTSAATGTYWEFDLTSTVQTWISGTVANYGLTLFTSDTTTGQFQGATAAGGAPELVVTYVLVAQPPTALHPSSGAVSLAKPTLTFQTGADTLSIQVQVDPAANGTTPGFDSGEVASTAGLLDLSTTSYAGLADGATTQWRARAKNALGWSAWSSWVTFSRAAWKTATITSPGSTSEDPSPVVTATYGGTITAWRVLTKDALGAVVEDSGWTPSTAVAYGATKSVGAAGTAVVQIRDNVLRDATPGDPDYVEVNKAFTVTVSGTPSVIASLAGSQDGTRPYVTLTGTRAAGIPDEVAIYRDNVLVDRMPGANVFTGTAMTYVDKTVPMNVATTYKVYAIVNGNWSNASSTVTLTPRCVGLWLLDTASTDAAVIFGNDDQDQSQPELAIVHRPVSGPDGQAQVVRRRLSRYPREGAIAGEILDALGITAATSETALRNWIDNDAGHIYRLVMGNRNDPVILGDIEFTEVPVNGPGNGRVLNVSANWWYQS